MTETVTPTLNRRQQAKADTRVRMLAAARETFSNVGYEAATVRLIAKAAGMSTGAVFANWKDKAALYVDAVGHPPVTPEIGRQALRALQALWLADILDEPADSEAYGLAQRFAADVLDLAKVPPLAVPTGMEPEDTVKRFLRGQL